MMMIGFKIVRVVDIVVVVVGVVLGIDFFQVVFRRGRFGWNGWLLNIEFVSGGVVGVLGVVGVVGVVVGVLHERLVGRRRR